MNSTQRLLSANTVVKIAAAGAVNQGIMGAYRNFLSAKPKGPVNTNSPAAPPAMTPKVSKPAVAVNPLTTSGGSPRS